MSNYSPVRTSFWVHALAGLEAGVLGVFWMFLAFFLSGAGGGGIWSIPNLFSTLFYGDIAYQDRFVRSTWGGIALIVVLYGVLGMLWGCVWRDQRKPLLGFFGAITGLAVYYLFFNFLWNYADPLIPLYAPVRELQVAHILWGAALAKSPAYSRRIALTTIQQPLPPPPDPAPAQDTATSVTGEVIR